ncbi:hypothetical protein LCGC14_1905480 [marine sediment metagenome]|uniref:Uncharacterized protein n=1 Tax=marine sediment metagenome TaxID=412755 RepID=A0A0F9GIM6_9ZZZZ|nr:hypothetical protein [Candidatus Scalindua sp.]
MSVSQNASRPSIKEILSKDYWENNEKEMSVSWQDIVKSVGILGGMSIITGSAAFVFPLIIGVSQKMYTKMGIKCKKKLERSFSYDYPLVVLSLALSLKSTEKIVVAVDDTDDGSILEVELPSDWKSLAGKLLFEVIDKHKSKTCIKGTSIVLGQLIDYGKGKKALRETFDNTELFFNKITSH